MNGCSILIPTYFANQLLYTCLDSLFKNIPNAKIITYKNDIGWLKASNHLMQSVDTDVLLLNDDTIALTNLRDEMSNLAYSDPTIGMVGGKALSVDGSTIINYGIYIAPDGNTAHKHYGQPRDSVTIENQRAVEGSCMFIKREVLEKVGYFDEIFGLGYREELDLAFRVREAGYKVVSCPSAEYIHMVGQTHGKLGITNDTHTIFMERWGKKLKLGEI